MTTTPMTRYYMAVGDALGSAYVQSIESDEGGWVLYADVVSELVRLSARAGVLRAEVDAMRAFYCRDNTDLNSEDWYALSDAASKARAATDALEKETGHGE